VKSVCQESTDPTVSTTVRQVAWLMVFAVKVLQETGRVPAKLDGRERNVLFAMMVTTVINARIPALILVSLTESARTVSMVLVFVCLAEFNSLEIIANCAMPKIVMVPPASTRALIFVLKEVLVMMGHLELDCAITVLETTVEINVMNALLDTTEKLANSSAQNHANCLDTVMVGSMARVVRCATQDTNTLGKSVLVLTQDQCNMVCL